MRDYELDTIKAIRAAGNKYVNTLSDKQMRELYRQFSDGGWLTVGPRTIKVFIDWATASPCDRKEDE